jgi:serine/threonine-protein kinase HipA
MDREVLVYVDLDGVPHVTGRLWSRARKGRDTASFEYDARWLENPIRFSLEPALSLGPGPFHTPADLPLFGAIGDSAPDRWRHERAWPFPRRGSRRSWTGPCCCRGASIAKARAASRSSRR